MQVVAPEWSTIYDVDLITRPVWQVPVGRFYLLTYRGGLRTAVETVPRTCQRGQSLRLELPAAPGDREHALVVPLRLPEPKLSLADLGLTVRLAGGRRDVEAALPKAVAGMGPRVLALFPGIAASAGAERCFPARLPR